MWPVALSGRLPVNALVGRYPTNKLIGRDPIPCHESFPHTPCGAREHPALPPVSRSYSGAWGRSVTHYSPVRHSHPGSKLPGIPFDLHVLSTPPAFILSQNRTLHKKTMRKAKNRLSQNKIDDRLIRKGDSHENPDPHQPPSRTPTQDNQTPRTEAGTGLAIIDYKEVVQTRS